MMYESFKLFAGVLTNRTRFDIVSALKKRDMSVTEICNHTGYEQSRVSHNLKCLLNCGFVDVKQDGKKRIYRLNPDIKDLISKIEEHISVYELRLKRCGILRDEREEIKVLIQ